jgi:hypothetical protein
MQVRSKANRIFHRDPKNQSNSETFHLKPSPDFVEVPDWLADNVYFQQSEADGSVQRGQILSVQTVKPPADTPEDIGLPQPAPVPEPRVRIKKAKEAKV